MVADGNSPSMGESIPDSNPGFESRRPVDGPQTSVSEIARNLGAAWAALSAYTSAQADRLRLAIRSLILLIIIGVVAGVFAAGALVAGTVFFIRGAAEGIATLLGGRVWAGDLITGAGIVGCFTVGGYIMLRGFSKAARARTMAGYQKQSVRN